MVKLFSPENEVQLAIVKSLLEAEGIPFFVHNDHFGSMRVGIQIELLNKKTVLVDEQFEERAREIVADFLRNTEPEPTHMPERYSVWDKIRMLFEGLFFGWVMPGKRWRSRDDPE
jgi:hypothetical protein